MARVAVLLGGQSAEREVSLRTGGAIAAALTRGGHQVREVDRSGADLCRCLADQPADAAFVALHGRFGEDGTVQGLLELLGIPYTGSGVLASALAMDKTRSKALFQALGVPTPEFRLLAPGEQDPGALPFPLVAKPPREGSTIGISVVRTPGELPAALAAARRYDAEVLLERFVEGRELTVGVLDGEPLPIVEIVAEGGFYDYAAKYTPGRTRYLCPAPLAPDEARAVTAAGVRAYRVLGCEGAARVDVILGGDGTPWVLEANTIPGMTPTSLLPKAAAAGGLEFDALVERMLAGARVRA